MPQHLINGGHTVVGHTGGLAHGVGLAHGAVLGHGVGLTHGTGLAHGVGLGHPATLAHGVGAVHPGVGHAIVHNAPVVGHSTDHGLVHAARAPIVGHSAGHGLVHAVHDAPGSNYNVAVSDDGTGVREGSYSVALP